MIAPRQKGDRVCKRVNSSHDCIWLDNLQAYEYMHASA
jgi:hypothetical protein